MDNKNISVLRIQKYAHSIIQERSQKYALLSWSACYAIAHDPQVFSEFQNNLFRIIIELSTWILPYNQGQYIYPVLVPMIVNYKTYFAEIEIDMERQKI